MVDHTRSDSVSISGTFAYGLTNWLEAAGSIPFQWDESRVESINERLADQSTVGLGGIGLRLIAALPTRGFETTAILSLTLPTGRDEFEADRLYSLVGINVAKMMRPTFVFGGLAWQHDWEKSLDGVVYTGGIGFFLNHMLSLGFEIGGTRFINPPIASAYDIVSATMRLTYQATPSFGITPFLSMGLTDSAPDAVVGANLFWRF